MPLPQRFALVMAGGRGTRFWPKSRKAHPKQVLSIVGERTLIQQTVERITRVLPPENVFVITSRNLRKEIVRQLPQVPAAQIVAEPLARNTAPCIGLGARLVFQRDPKALMGVFPADHVVTRSPAFVKTLRSAFKAAESRNLVVVGIPPRWAETGYGYLEFPKSAKAGDSTPQPLRSFREKPDQRTASRYLKAGNYYWNSGMFFWRAETFLDSLNEHLPNTAQQIGSMRGLNEKGFERDLARLFPLCESISVDYGVMEKATNVVGIAAGDFGWNDVGSWQAVYELSQKDADANALRSGELLAIESTGNFVDAGGKTVALVGVDGLVVVETKDALLVTTRERAHLVGEMVKLIERKKRDDLL